PARSRRSILQTALHATKANGQPDWGTRIAAVRALAALPPEEDEAKPAHQPATPSITVYDLPPGATRVLHYPASGAAEGPPTPAPEAPEGFQNAGSVSRTGGCAGSMVHTRARIPDRAGLRNSLA